MSLPPALLFGVPLADLTMDETLDLIGELVEDGRATGRTHQVTTVNVDFLVNALGDESVRRILQRADVNLVDGMPVAWASRLLGMRVRERVAGADLVSLLADRSQRTGHRVHFYGSTPDVATAARAVIAERYPAAHVTIDPGVMIADPEDVPADVITAITDVAPDILCVALGNPKQERFIAANRERLGVPVLIGVGGSLEMLVGKRRRAPRWVQVLGLEWVVRALQEPARLGRRYARDIRVFLPAFARAVRSHRRRRNGLGLAVETTDGQVTARFVPGATTTAERWSEAAGMVRSGCELTVEAASGETVLDGAAAALVGLVQIADRNDAAVTWRDDPGPIVSTLQSLDLLPVMVGLDESWRRPVGP